ncbi:hypothetical protein M9Y10_020353 [Tritrichomonas musculus]|uniref:Protein kinase domain-containing protein n=1 Tax=Tritrichomonas musculus TaxID=1915356 RepID=A0ABR2HGW6_9EUKA
MINLDLELNGPYYQDYTTPLPPENEDINGYQTFLTLALTKSSIVMVGNCIHTNSKKALKFVKRRKNTLDRIRNEISLQMICSHPNILKIDDCFPYREYICIVSKFSQYGSLHDHITKNYPHGLPESTASIIMNQILEAVSFIHKLNIAHRDIKPGNFLIFDTNPEHPKVLLNDFGLAKVFNEGETCKEALGTPILSAPEIIAKLPYNKSADSWSLGVTLFFLLNGNFPFPSFELSPKECKLRIVKGQLNYKLLTEKNISNEAIDLIKKFCHLSPKMRITPSEALLHPWIASNQKQEDHEFEYRSVLYESSEEYEFIPGT